MFAMLEDRKRPSSEREKEGNRTAEGVRLPDGGGDGGVCRGGFLVLVVCRFGVGEDDEGVCRGGALKKGEWFDGAADEDVVVAGSRVEWRDCDSLKWALLHSGGGGLRFWKREEDDARRWWSGELRP
ncbi:hypothetical protein LR48_Vigan50s006000 [Vigna angularis]|uniref:Uncharacterized protein n=1 Tax=Phaseolus angularis TaxID=3914 RepID=A0A0L9T3G1_PHAAN|nr:hypothetical protein LR48_Vigan50s006000 [Vigna angularis]